MLQLLPLQLGYLHSMGCILPGIFAFNGRQSNFQIQRIRFLMDLQTRRKILEKVFHGTPQTCPCARHPLGTHRCLSPRLSLLPSSDYICASALRAHVVLLLRNKERSCTTVQRQNMPVFLPQQEQAGREAQVWLLSPSSVPPLLAIYLCFAGCI